MIFIRLFLCFLMLMGYIEAPAQIDSTNINKKRLFISSGLLGSTLIASYYYVENTWWSEKKTSFHFDDGAQIVLQL